MSAPQNIAVIGGGSWATAIVKMLSENREHILWWMRNPDTINHIKKYGNNPNYISSADLHQDKLTISDNLDDIVGQADCLILAVPSAFLRTILKQMNGSLKNKFIHSISKYWPEINPDKLHPDYTGIRPKITKPNETMKDFSIQTMTHHGIKNFINLQGIESPGLTSSLAIGKFIMNLL